MNICTVTHVGHNWKWTNFDRNGIGKESIFTEMALEKNQFWQKRPNFGIHGTGKEPNLTEMVLEKNPLWHKWYWKRSNFYINGNLLVKIAVFTLTFKIASWQLELHYETHQWIPLIQTSIQTQHSFNSDFNSNTTFCWFRLSFKHNIPLNQTFIQTQHSINSDFHSNANIPLISCSSYFPNMAPCDFWLFSKMKMPLKGTQLQPWDDIMQDMIA